MNKQSTLFNPGKILHLAEQSLTSVSLAMEHYTQKLLNHFYKKDVRNDAIKKSIDRRKKSNKELTKAPAFEKNNQITERLAELEAVNHNQVISQDIEIDKN